MENMYKISELHFSYNKGVPIFRGLNMDVPREGLTLITGKNGAGKTTLCRLLTGLTGGYAGSISLQNKEISSMGQASIMENVLYIKQDLTGNLMGVTPDDDLRIWQNRFIEKDSENRAGERERALKNLGVNRLQNIPIWELSFGQKRRTMLAVLPLLSQKYWIIDEPTASLDQEGISLLKDILAEKVSRGGGALILTHRPALFSSKADNLYVMTEGIVSRDERK